MAPPRALLVVRLLDGTQFFANDSSAAELLIVKFGKPLIDAKLKVLPDASVEAITRAPSVPPLVDSGPEQFDFSSVLSKQMDNRSLYEKFEQLSSKLDLATSRLVTIANRELELLGPSASSSDSANVCSSALL